MHLLAADRQSAGMTVADLVVQLHSLCGRRPAGIALRKYGAACAHRIPGGSGWVVPLVGDDLHGLHHRRATVRARTAICEWKANAPRDIPCVDVNI